MHNTPEIWIDWSILTACQPVKGYFMTIGQGITFIVNLGLVIWLNCMLTQDGYLMPNSNYTYRWFLSKHFVGNIFKWARANLFAHS